ncbi:efflux RND transporter periplasmic adaptor subunit [Olsenella sp. DSM 107455]|uniref:Efflux RND transporter periplasmic adaptor subunit n=1 Tax=Thermophilibacter gallinarum TaxID=2779357 RepID=A0ABR9QSV2_9ACTN|nr:efflux RND transporter periplasmic adaptor subunit [Thermophilibacter gallinarum]MBE5024165.1 efflux RND transporter periplasmic adaptor subunit [Thermophilibacter gallinarum]
MTRDDLKMKLPHAEGEDAPDAEEDVEERLALESLQRHRRARRRKKVIAAGVVGGIVVAAGIAWAVLTSASSQPAEEAPLQTIPLMREEFSESVQATGTAQPLTSVVVTPKADGVIASVDVALDDAVAEGQVLLTIKNDELDRAVKQAELDLRTKRAENDAVQKAYNELYYADEVDKDALAAKLIELETSRLNLEIAQDAYDDAVATAAGRTVKAPASGSVVALNAVAGAAVGAGGTTSSGAEGGGSGPLVQIADLSQMTVKVQVNEVDISRIAVGQAARVTFSALPGTMLDAQVTRISTTAAADPYGGSGGVVTYDVELLIPDPAPELKPGMTASVEILMQSVPDALTVPVSALMTDDGVSYYVYVMSDPETEAVERRDVSVPAQSDTTAVIEGDVSEGDLVVLDPFSVDPTSAGGDAAAGAAGGDGADVAAADAPAA